MHNYVAEVACLNGVGITQHVTFVLHILQHEQTECICNVFQLQLDSFEVQAIDCHALRKSEKGCFVTQKVKTRETQHRFGPFGFQPCQNHRRPAWADMQINYLVDHQH